MTIKGSMKMFLWVTLILLFSNSQISLTFAGEWEKPWSSVKSAAAKRCAKIFEDFQLQAVCMENEKEGYDNMQGDFSMPHEIARKAKNRCERVFADFQLQAVCMQNEKEGYDKMKSY